MMREMRELPIIANNSNVYVQHKPHSEYPAIVLSQVCDRSYKVKLQNGSILIKNRRFIKNLYQRL